MKCKYCGDEMDLVFCDDNGGGGHKADQCYNLYACENPDCMTVCRVDVWENKGKRWISPINE